ncbi:hypothetical protein N0V82_010237 [Gnomoniopsis sp. IMI 355080]|nr:hypothetical protein N0V82_010237 [Gnomoniopsis sp. IMI 355080]
MGIPDSALNPALAYKTRGLELLVWWEMAYLIAAGFIKTSIGVAVIRIALERRYCYTIYVLLFLSIASCVGGVIWELAACRPISTRWNVYAGTCVVPGLVPIAYAITAVTVITDAGYALVPIFILRRLSMQRRVKYGLMFVLGLGSVAAFAASLVGGSVEEAGGWSPGRGKLTMLFLDNNVWIPLLSQIELAIGLITGSLPGIAKMFHFFDPPTKSTSRRGQEGWVANHSVGGSPVDDMISLHELGSRNYTSESKSTRRPSVPKLSGRSVKGVWQVKTVT